MSQTNNRQNLCLKCRKTIIYDCLSRVGAGLAPALDISLQFEVEPTFFPLERYRKCRNRPPKISKLAVPCPNVPIHSWSTAIFENCCPMPQCLNLRLFVQCILDLRANPHSLHIDKLLDTKGRKFPTIAATLNSTKRKARIRCSHAVNKHTASFDICRQFASLLDVACPQVAAQTKPGIIRQFNRMSRIASANNRCRRTKGLVDKDRHLRSNIGQYGWFIEEAFPFPWLASNQNPCTLPHRCLHQLIERLPQVLASHRTDLGIVLQRITDLQLRRVSNKFLLELISNRFDDDIAFSSDTALSIILEAGRDRDLCRLIKISILQHNKSIRATQFQHCLFQSMPTRARHLNSCCITPGECHCRDPWVRDECSSLRTWHKYRSQNTARQPGFLNDMLDLQSNPRDIGGMLQHSRVAGHQSRSSKAK